MAQIGCRYSFLYSAPGRNTAIAILICQQVTVLDSACLLFQIPAVYAIDYIGFL
jgi:hypothetical protein